MFVFYSNRLGCLGSIIISVVLTAVLVAIMVIMQGGFSGR